MIDISFDNHEEEHEPNFVPERFLSAPLPNLERLGVSDGMSQRWKDELFESISLSTRNLRHLSISTKIETIRTLSDEAWNNIKVLEVKEVIDLDPRILKLTSVEEMKGMIADWPSMATPHCSFPNLRQVSLLTHPRGIRRVQFPSLEHLGVFDTSEWEETIDDSTLECAEFPMLTRMVLCNLYDPAQWFSNVSMPNLENLEIHILARVFEPPSLGAFAALRLLDIRSTCADSLIIDMLGGLHSLEWLTAVPWTDSNIVRGPPVPGPVHYDFTYGVELVKKLSLWNHGMMHCKNLQFITLGDSDARLHTRKKVLVPLVKNLMSNRRGVGYPLRKVDVWWRMGDHAQGFL